MKNKIRLFPLLMLLTIFLISCNQELDYATDEPFIIVSSSIAGPDTAENFYPTIISLDVDGNLTLYSEPSDDIKMAEDRPIFETTISKSEVEQVQQLLETNHFWKMEEDVSDDGSVDGGFTNVTVQLVDDEKAVGGLNPRNEEFLEIATTVRNYADGDERAKWREEIEAHILEMNPEYRD